MRAPSRSVAAALADSAAAPLLQRLAATRSAVEIIAPAVAEAVQGLDLTKPGTADLNGGILLINTATAAEAAKLRQAVPGLLALLHQRGAEVNQIRLRIQPYGGAQQAAGMTRVSSTSDHRIDEQCAAALRFAQDLAARLPDTALRRAAERLQRKIAARSGR